MCGAPAGNYDTGRCVSQVVNADAAQPAAARVVEGRHGYLRRAIGDARLFAAVRTSPTLESCRRFIDETLSRKSERRRPITGGFSG